MTELDLTRVEHLEYRNGLETYVRHMAGICAERDEAALPFEIERQAARDNTRAAFDVLAGDYSAAANATRYALIAEHFTPINERQTAAMAPFDEQLEKLDESVTAYLAPIGLEVENVTGFSDEDVGRCVVSGLITFDTDHLVDLGKHNYRYALRDVLPPFREGVTDGPAFEEHDESSFGDEDDDDSADDSVSPDDTDLTAVRTGDAA